MTTNAATLAATPSLEDVFGLELAFTAAYQQYRDADPAIRELRCLETQYPQCLTPLTDQQHFAGGLEFPLVGVNMQYWNWKEDSPLDRDGYYCDEAIVRKRLDRYGFAGAERARIDEMLTFWRGETTMDRIRARFTPEMNREMPFDDYINNPGIIWPLYRMCGPNMDYDKLLQLGVPGLRELILRRRAAADAAQVPLFDGMLGALDLLARCAQHYATQAREQLRTADHARSAELAEIADALDAIAVRRPQTLREAIQLVWLYTVLTNPDCNFGRLDVYLGDFYVNDLAAGRVTPEQARRWLVSWFNQMVRDSRIVVGGVGRRNEAAADAFALVVLDALPEHRLNIVGKHFVPQVSLRFYAGQDERLYQRALDLLGDGLTFPILYNDDVNVPAVAAAFDVSREQAEQYVFFGCGEYVLDHCSFGTPNVVINLLKALELTLYNGRDPVTDREYGLAEGGLAAFASFDELLGAYQRQIEHACRFAADFQYLQYEQMGRDVPYLFLSMLYDDCIERGRAIFDGGIRHLGGTNETYSNISTADSLTAIKRVIYETGQLTPEQLLAALDADFEGYAHERRLLLDAPKFGNDDDVADELARIVHEHVCVTMRDQRDRTPLDSYLVVVINNGSNHTFGKHCQASADGRRAFTQTSNGNAPTPGSDVCGPTALLNSMLKLRADIHAGAVHNIKFTKEMFTRRRDLIEALFETYWAGGGTQLMVSVVDPAELLDAMENPERHRNLIVRVGGFSSPFVFLNRATQQEIVDRTLYS